MIIHRSAVIAGAACLLVGVTGCVPGRPAATVTVPGPTVTVPGPTVTVTRPAGATPAAATPAQSTVQRTVEVRAGQKTTLPVGTTNSSVGYAWVLKDQGDAGVARVALTPDGNPTPCTGCGYEVQLEVTGVKPGTTTVRVEFSAREGLHTANPPHVYTIKVT